MPIGGLLTGANGEGKYLFYHNLRKITIKLHYCDWIIYQRQIDVNPTMYKVTLLSFLTNQKSLYCLVTVATKRKFRKCSSFYGTFHKIITVDTYEGQTEFFENEKICRSWDMNSL